MEPGDIIRRSWEVYRRYPRHLITIAAIVFVPLGVVAALLGLIGWPGALLANLLGVAAIFLVQGALVKAVEDVRDGRVDIPVAEAYGYAGARLLPLAAAGIMATIGILAGLTLLIVPGLMLLTWWLVISPVIMLEHRPVLEAFGRSRGLVRGSAWPVFGVMVLTLLILLALGLAVGIAVAPIDNDGVRNFLGQAVGNSLAAPFLAVAWTLTYFQLREIEEAG